MPVTWSIRHASGGAADSAVFASAPAHLTSLVDAVRFILLGQLGAAARV